VVDDADESGGDRLDFFDGGPWLLLVIAGREAVLEVVGGCAPVFLAVVSLGSRRVEGKVVRAGVELVRDWIQVERYDSE